MSSHVAKAGPSRPVGRPAGTSSQHTRDEILAAALEAFAEAGFEAMSVRELCRRLGVSHNLVHHHFGSKDDLWRAALSHGIGPTVEELAQLLGRAGGSPDPREILRTGFQQATQLMLQRPAIVRIVTDESARPGPRIDHLYERYVGPLIEALAAFLSESRAARDLGAGAPDVDPQIAALFAVSAGTALFTHGGLAGKLGLGIDDSTESKELARETTGALVDLILDGLAPRDHRRSDG